tara:strand:+ start:1061 stop:1429 length:369 start_codon:yes stop_codon:yes gene_type:complete
MGILDPDEGRMKPTQSRPRPAYQDPFLRPGFKPDEARPDFDAKPPPSDPVKPDPLPSGKPKPRPTGIGPSGNVSIDTLVAEGEVQDTSTSPKVDFDFSITEDQKFMLIGLAVIGAFAGFYKR